MSGWFGQKSKEMRETVDKEAYDKAVDENMKLKGQVDKLMLNHKESGDRLSEAERRLRELTGQSEEESIKLGLLAADETRKRDKYLNILVKDVSEILVLEQQLKSLEEKNLKLKERLSKADSAKQAEVKEHIELIKQIEGEYLIASVSSDRRARMSRKEEEEEKSKALLHQLNATVKHLATLEVLNNSVRPIVEKSVSKPSFKKSPAARRERKEKGLKGDERIGEFGKKENSPGVSKGWDDDVEIQ